MSGDISFDGLLAVAIVAAVIPIILGFFPKLLIPDAVLEIVAGIIIGPAVLNWVQTDDAINVLAKLGVAFLLFLAGLELDFRVLRGKPLRYGLVSFVASLRHRHRPDWSRCGVPTRSSTRCSSRSSSRPRRSGSSSRS